MFCCEQWSFDDGSHNDYDILHVADMRDLLLLRFGADEAAEEGDELSVASPNWDLTRRLVEPRILCIILVIWIPK